MMGYPLILHTDNGTEFVAKDVMEFVKDLDPSITTVHGRPRKPNEQGSVERSNRTLKDISSSLE
jgi:transposase InsO family protein